MSSKHKSQGSAQANDPVFSPLRVGPDWRSLCSYLHDLEPAEAFQALEKALQAELAPADALEQLWCDDVVSLAWESHRLRRVKRFLMEASVRSDIVAALEARYPDDTFRLSFQQSPAEALAKEYWRGEKLAQQKVEEVLNSRIITKEESLLSGYLAALDQMSFLDKMIESSDKRRDAVIFNIHKRRSDRFSFESKFDIL